MHSNKYTVNGKIADFAIEAHCTRNREHHALKAHLLGALGRYLDETAME